MKDIVLHTLKVRRVMQIHFPTAVDQPASQREQQTTPVGAHITTLKGLRSGAGASGLGRIGAFAAASTARSWSGLFILSNAHVLNAFDTQQGDAVYQPVLTVDDNAVRFDGNQLHPIGELVDSGCDGPYRFAYPGEQAADYFIDCATARVELAETTPCLSDSNIFTRVARAHPLDALPNRALKVRLAGVHDKPAGRVTSVNTSVLRSDGQICPNCIVIESLPGLPPFASEGDSGALLVDQFDRAIGLLWGVNLEQPSIAYACHIHPVLDRLRLTLSRQRAVVFPQSHQGTGKNGSRKRATGER